MTAVAIIPARGGSKRIPKKNIKIFAGKPIIAYSIEAAKESELFDRIIVSTDSEEIVKVSAKYRAEIPFTRPIELSDDYTGTDEVFIHAIEWLLENDKPYDYACCIYPTAPLLKVDYLKKGLELLKKNEATSTFTVTTFPSPIFRALKINKENRVEVIWPEYEDYGSQDLPKAYHDAGQFYWVKVDKYIKERRIWSKDAMPIVLPRYLVQDIDTIEDWETTEMLFQQINKKD